MSAHQPGFMPWGGFFGKIIAADVFVLLDDVQISKNSYDNRVKFRSKDGAHLITVPIHAMRDGSFENWQTAKIDETRNWRRKHISSLSQWYGKAPFRQHISRIEEIYEQKAKTILSHNLSLIRYMLRELNIKTEIVLSSELNLNEKKSDYVLEMVKKLDGKTYLSGELGRDYLDLPKFEQFGIDVKFQKYVQQTYQQLHPDFEPNLSTLDLMLNLGPSANGVIENSQVFS